MRQAATILPITVC